MFESLAADFMAHWPLYLSMPVIAAVIGYVTKILAIQMMFWPIEFIGIKPYLGWQGIIPNRAKHMAEIAVDIMTARLINPREIFDRFDPERIARELQQPMVEVMEDVTDTVMSHYFPKIWEGTPLAVRERLLKRVQAEAPAIVAELMDQMKENIDQVFDMKDMVVTNLQRDKELLNSMFKEVGDEEFRFIRNSGIYFGFIIGIVQMFAWMMTHSPWIMPIFGGLTGLITDWLALQMIFRPRYPTKYLGLFTWQGLFLKRQNEVAKKYGELMATRILTPSAIMEALLTGPLSNKLYEMIQRQVQRMVDEQAGMFRPVVVFSVGTRRYQEMKNLVAARVIKHLPATFKSMEKYAADTMDIRNVMITKMQALTKEEFEAVLRPAFQQDEWKLIACGAVLGFLVGELQVWLLLH